jgi:tetratricopeptide (TPR) repeat protein
LLEQNASDLWILHESARLYQKLSRFEEEAEAYNRIVEINPLDFEASRLGKEAAARSSIASGRWLQEENFPADPSSDRP